MPVESARFSPQGDQIVSGGADRKVILWERTRPEAWYGVLLLPEFWLLLPLVGGLLWSIARDYQELKLNAPDPDENWLYQRKNKRREIAEPVATAAPAADAK